MNDAERSYLLSKMRSSTRPGKFDKIAVFIPANCTFKIATIRNSPMEVTLRLRDEGLQLTRNDVFQGVFHEMNLISFKVFALIEKYVSDTRVASIAKRLCTEAASQKTAGLSADQIYLGMCQSYSHKILLAYDYKPLQTDCHSTSYLGLLGTNVNFREEREVFPYMSVLDLQTRAVYDYEYNITCIEE